MKKHYCSRVLSCTPSGKITNLDAVMMRRMVNQCLTDIAGMRSVTEKAKRLLSMADVCRTSRYLRTALNLYREVVITIIPDAIMEYSMRNKELLTRACTEIDRLWREFSQNSKMSREAEKARLLYMCIHEDYRSEVLHINEVSTSTLQRELVKDYYDMVINS
ncbi:MAG: hypothetical protein OSJ46_09260 [Duncaniella sp.]|nr:hypothetical protein [Duncaniella sp.]HBI58598.1 hypothetical protein [Porphyromonadaceae bacterium]